MLVVMDVGNTNTVIGVYEGDQLLSDWRIRTEKEATIDELGILLRNLFQAQGITLTSGTELIISCVVPPMVNTLEGFAQRYLKVKPLWVGPGIKTGMPIYYDNPREVGADRIVNAVAAYEQVHGAVIVVDFGTATTFDVVSKQGEYLGGVIAPGVMISCEALFLKASKLPRVEIFVKPKSIIAKDTISSMNAGIIYGYVGLVDGIVARLKEALGDKARVIATGGLACLIASETKSIDTVDDYLTLKGLKIIYERNRPRPERHRGGGGA
jgi:type III pantothenate kinase